MKMKCKNQFYHILFALLFFVISADAQIFYIDSGKKDDSLEVMQWFKRARNLSDSLSKAGIQIHESRADIFENNDDIYLLYDGRFDFWVWNKTSASWKNLYTGQNHGYNFGAKKWIKNGTICSYGGYGFWQSHGQIICYDIISQWQIIPQSLDLPYGIPLIRNDTLTILSDTTYLFDIKLNKIISKTVNNPVRNKHIEVPYGFIETTDYTVLQNNNLLIYKPTMQMYSSNLKAIPDNILLIYSSYFWIHGNTINMYSADLHRKFSLNLDKIHKTALTPNSSVTNNHRIHATWILLGFGVPLLLIFSIFHLNKQDKNDISLPPSVSEFERLGQKLLPLSGQPLSVEQLDELLGLHQPIPTDTQRFKRFHLIRDINKDYKLLTGKELIIRQRDPDDGRRFVYYIQK